VDLAAALLRLVEPWPDHFVEAPAVGVAGMTNLEVLGASIVQQPNRSEP
jgi:hypothetical protein